MEASMHEAKTQLSRLVESMLGGEEVILTRGRTRIPIAKLVPFNDGIPAGEVRKLPAPVGGRRPIGLYAGQFELDPELFAPVQDPNSPEWKIDDADASD